MEDMKCPQCGEEFDIAVDNMEAYHQGTEDICLWGFVCEKCGYKWRYSKYYTLISATNDKL